MLIVTRLFLFLSMPTQHASWLLGKLNLYQLLFIVMLQLAVGIACMHQRVQLLTQLHWSLEGFPLVIWKVCWGWAMLTCDQKNWRGKGWARVLDGPWFGACFDYFWLIESCYLLIEQVHSVLTPQAIHVVLVFLPGNEHVAVVCELWCVHWARQLGIKKTKLPICCMWNCSDLPNMNWTSNH